MKKLTVFYLCSLIFALSSCKPKQIITEKTYTDTLIITQQVVTTPTRPDSALLDVLFR